MHQNLDRTVSLRDVVGEEQDGHEKRALGPGRRGGCDILPERQLGDGGCRRYGIWLEVKGDFGSAVYAGELLPIAAVQPYLDAGRVTGQQRDVLCQLDVVAVEQPHFRNAEVRARLHLHVERAEGFVRSVDREMQGDGLGAGAAARRRGMDEALEWRPGDRGGGRQRIGHESEIEVDAAGDVSEAVPIGGVQPGLDYDGI